jgi:hypothetical protein
MARPNSGTQYRLAKGVSRRISKHNTISGKLDSYRVSAKQRGIPFNLTREEFITFWQLPCDYCGDSIDTIGLDRVDNDKGYELTNLVPCCYPCNIAKANQTRESYINRCRRVAARHPTT